MSSVPLLSKPLRALWALPVLALVLAVPARSLDPKQLVRGVVHPLVPTAADPSITYALYLPKDFDPAKRWPILVVFDPRKRGADSAAIFAEAADRHGWIVASSNDTESDVPTWDNNLRASTTMLTDLDRRLPLDAQRFYASGMSGTAVLAWVLGQKTNAFAGVVSVGGRPTAGYENDPPRFALWAAAGRTDFNHDPTEQLDELAAKGNRPHRFEVFDGPHGWFDAAEAERAVAWLEVVAIREKRRGPDDELVRSTFEADLAGVDPLLAAGDLLGALRRLEAIERTYTGLVDVAAVSARRKQLERDPALKAARKDVAWGQRFEAGVIGRTAQVERQLRSDPTAIYGKMRNLVNVQELVDTAALDGPRGEAGRRAIAIARVQLGFYQANAFMAAGEWESASAVLRIALDLGPGDGRAWYNLACAEARLGHADEALAALAKAAENGARTGRPIADDPDLESLRERPEFAALAARLDPR